MLFEIGYIGLFISSFLASTVIPLSSETLLIAMLSLTNEYNPYLCWTLVTLGNWGGGMVTFYMGYLGKMEWIEKYFKVEHRKLRRMKIILRKYGLWLTFFVWLPIIGEVIMLTLGLTRSNTYMVATASFIGRGVRFAVVIYLTLSAKGLF